MNALFEIVLGTILYVAAFGLVWMNAWMFNPALNSNTINFIGAVTGIIVVFCANREELS
jgi:DMSO reductase anchor subunit